MDLHFIVKSPWFYNFAMFVFFFFLYMSYIYIKILYLNIVNYLFPREDKDNENKNI